MIFHNQSGALFFTHAYHPAAQVGGRTAGYYLQYSILFTSHVISSPFFLFYQSAFSLFYSFLLLLLLPLACWSRSLPPPYFIFSLRPSFLPHSLRLSLTLHHIFCTSCLSFIVFNYIFRPSQSPSLQFTSPTDAQTAVHRPERSSAERITHVARTYATPIWPKSRACEGVM